MMKLGTLVGAKVVGQAVMKRGVGVLKSKAQAQRAKLDEGIEEKQGQIQDLGQEAGELAERGAGRLESGEVEASAGRLESAGRFTQEASGLRTETEIGGGDELGVGARATNVSYGGETAETYSTSEGLTTAETARATAIRTEATGLGEEITADAGATALETAVSAIPVVGEIIGLGTAIGEGLKTAFETHRAQMRDQAKMASASAIGEQAQEYAGFNRPSFGTMALPSFDTSKSNVALSE